MPVEDLDVWKKAVLLCIKIYKTMAGLRDYGFRDQITRSSLSIPSNIAEGMERFSVKEKVRFLDFAKGSAAELRTQIHIGREINYIPREDGERWIEESREISSMLVGLMRSFEKDG